MTVYYSQKHLNTQLILSLLWLAGLVAGYMFGVPMVMYGFGALFVFGMLVYLHNVRFGFLRIKGTTIILYGRARIKEDEVYQMKKTEKGIVLFTQKKTYKLHANSLETTSYNRFVEHLNFLSAPWV